MRESQRAVTLEWGQQVLRLSNYENDPEEEHHFTDLVGWYGGVGVHGDQPQRELGHGLFGRPAVRTGRELTLSGSLWFREERYRDIADRYVSGILGDGQYGKLTYVLDGLETYARVRLGGAVKHDTKGHQWIDFEIPLTAADPRIYGPEQIITVTPPGYGRGIRYASGMFAGGSALRFYSGPPPGGIIRNSGNAEAWPTVVIRGSWPGGFRIHAGRAAVDYPYAVFEQTPAVVDMAAGSITIGGDDRTHLAARRDWISVPEYGSTTVRIEQFAPSEGWAEIHTRDTYI